MELVEKKARGHEPETMRSTILKYGSKRLNPPEDEFEVIYQDGDVAQQLTRKMRKRTLEELTPEQSEHVQKQFNLTTLPYIDENGDLQHL